MELCCQWPVLASHLQPWYIYPTGCSCSNSWWWVCPYGSWVYTLILFFFLYIDVLFKNRMNIQSKKCCLFGDAIDWWGWLHYIGLAMCQNSLAWFQDQAQRAHDVAYSVPRIICFNLSYSHPVHTKFFEGKYLAHPNFLITYKCESHVGWIIQLRLDLHHQLLDPEVELLVNPAIWMTWSDEDFIGRICRLCRKTHVLSSPQRTIDRALSLYRKQFGSHFDLAYLQPIPENQAWKDVLHWFWSGRGWSGQSVSAVVSEWVIDGIMGEPIVNFFWNRQLIGRLYGKSWDRLTLLPYNLFP